eukprot:TRINITY_DN6796_c0_g1_i1.p1 TRINITY_DN6796_c0_g1~~TRINITY_DN6796_c0_g1_i1.p1  ORF type:complete len:495 (+),score=91.75 TRINITY_DN6796_c0_g1_i1:74-1486(+)
MALGAREASVAIFAAVAAMLVMETWAEQSCLSGDSLCAIQTESIAAETESPALSMLQQRAGKKGQEQADDEMDTLDPDEGFADMGILDETAENESSDEKRHRKRLHAVKNNHHGGTVNGDAMTMWDLTKDTMVGSSCQYANAGQGGLESPAAQTPLIKKSRLCAVNAKMYQGGFACGRCYKISYTGEASTDPGRPGSELVQIVDSGAWRNFDCIMPTFKSITGAGTGVFRIHYKRAKCPVEGGGATATVTASSFYFTSLVLSNLPYPAREVSMELNGEKHKMSYLHSAVFQTYTGSHSGASFQARLEDGSTVSFKDCFSSLPQSPGAYCTSRGHSEEGSGSEGYSTTASPPAGHHASPPADHHASPPADQHDCCSKCDKYCSPKSGMCHSHKHRDYYKDCSSSHASGDHGHDSHHSHESHGEQCLPRNSQCGGSKTTEWTPGTSSTHCCNGDRRGPLKCKFVNEWFSQCE